MPNTVERCALQAISTLANAIHLATQGNYKGAQNGAEKGADWLNTALHLAEPEPKTITVRMHYFSQHGKWRTEGVWVHRGSYVAHHQIVDEIKQLRANGELPGLTEGIWHRELIVLIYDMPEHPGNHPVLLLP